MSHCLWEPLAILIARPSNPFSGTEDSSVGGLSPRRPPAASAWATTAEAPRARPRDPVVPRVVVRVLLWLQVLVAGMRVLGTSGHAAPLTATPGTLDNSFLVNLLNMGPALGPVLRAAPALRMHGVVLGRRHPLEYLHCDDTRGSLRCMHS